MARMNQRALLCLLALAWVSLPAAAQPARPMPANAQEPIKLWPGQAPGEGQEIGPERDTTEPDPNTPPEKYITRLGNVSTPTLTVFPAPADRANGAAVVVCPGGGYSILAYDLEGTEICQWLNSVGVTGVLLKYRVPTRKDDEKHLLPLQDAQRAISLVRSRAKEWKLDPQRIGVLGFSAGGHLAAAASNQFEHRGYTPIDAADEQSCRPDFSILVYPAYLSPKDKPHELNPEIAVTGKTPPAFIVMTQDDPLGIDGIFTYARALKSAEVSCELHLYPTGGHGYGLRPSEHGVTAWPQRAAEWMERRGLSKKE